MFGSTCNDRLMQGFREYMRSALIVSEETIDAYIRYLKAVTDRLGVGVEKLASNNAQINDTIARIESVKGWSEKTKSNYRTAINRLHSYLTSKDNEHEMSLMCDCTSKTKALKSYSAEELKSKGECILLSQINEIEKMTREQENKIWASVFMIISGYALAMPPIVANVGDKGIGFWGALLVSLSSVFALTGVVLFIPVLRRSSRQLREIQCYGEKYILMVNNQDVFVPSIGHLMRGYLVVYRPLQ